MDQSVEQWSAIAGYEGAYEVNNFSRVRSLDRIIGGRWPGSTRRWPGRILTATVNQSGYPQVQLCRAGRCVNALPHVLALRAFVGPPPPNMEARHLDGDSSNGAITNLRWGTKSENARDQVKHRTHRCTALAADHRGHLLISPNLTRRGIKRGHRQCLACARTRECWRKAVRAGRAFDFDAEANKKYALIMQQLSEPTGEPSFPIPA